MDAAVFVTGNKNKAKQVAEYLDIPIEHRLIDLVEIQSLNLREVVEDKARRAYAMVQGPVLVEDVSVTFKAFGALPGPFIKWFLIDPSCGARGLCRMLDGMADRNAVAEVMFAYYDGKHMECCSGLIEGEISMDPKGERGFGWDKIFIPRGYQKTRGEMPEDDYLKTSPRRMALELVKELLI